MQTKVFTELPRDNYMLRHAYSVLISKLYMTEKDLGFRTLAITSSNPREGKTSFSTALAIALAEIGKRTLLVNLDLRKKTAINRMSNNTEAFGISDYLAGKAELCDALCRTNFDNLFYMDSGRYLGDPVALLCSEKLTFFMKESSSDYDYVIVDSPALECNTDALVISDKTDATILVAKMGYTTIKDIRKAQTQLGMINVNILGVVLNKSSKRFYKRLFPASNYF